MQNIITIESKNALTAPERLDQNPAIVFLASLAPGSRRTMRGSLDAIARLLGYQDALDCPWHTLRYAHTTAIRSELAGRFAPNTSRKMLAGLRGVLKTSWRLGKMNAEDYHRAVDFGTVKGERVSRGRALTESEIGALFDACARDMSPAGVRDAAMLAVLLACGLRRSELCDLQLSDLDETAMTLRVLSGKGNKGRVLPLAPIAGRALFDWLTVRGREPGALFVGINKSGKIMGLEKIHSEAVFYALGKRAKEAGIEHTFSPHDLRRTFITGLLSGGIDPLTVSKLSGHSQIQTVARYDKRDQKQTRDAVNAIQLPYISRPEPMVEMGAGI